MSFAFGFAGDDIESDDEAGYLTDSLAKINIEQSPPSIVPKRHSLQDLVSLLTVKQLNTTRPSVDDNPND